MQVLGTNGCLLRSRLTASELPIFDFGPITRLLCIELDKMWVKQPPLVPRTFALQCEPYGVRDTYI